MWLVAVPRAAGGTDRTGRSGAGASRVLRRPDAEPVAMWVDEVRELDLAVVDERNSDGRAQLLGPVKRRLDVVDLDVEDCPARPTHRRGIPEPALVVLYHAVPCRHRRLAERPAEQPAVECRAACASGEPISK